MYKLRLPFFLLASAFIAFITQSCSKTAVTSTAYTTAAFQANINGSTWAPDTISTTVTYNPTTQSKVLYCISQKNTKQVIFSVKVPNAPSTPGFPIGSYPIDSLNVTAQYNVQVSNSSGVYVFMPHGTVGNGAGYITVTGVDSVKKLITGTFNFYSRSTTYDNMGNVVSISVDNITGGEFTGTPYIFSTTSGN